MAGLRLFTRSFAHTATAAGSRSAAVFLLAALAVAAVMGPFVVPAPAEAGTGSPPDPGQALVAEVQALERLADRYIVTFDGSTPGADITAARDGARGLGATVRFDYSRAVKGFAASLPAAAVTALRNHPQVLAVEPDYLVHTTGGATGGIGDTAGTTPVPVTWGLDRIDQHQGPLDYAYAYDATGAGVTAYVIDTGVRATHTEFTGRVVGGYTAIQDGVGTGDCDGHGTHVAATIGGSTFGVAKAVTVVPVRVLDCTGTGSVSGVIAGVEWVTVHHRGPSVANMSLAAVASTALDNAVAASIASGVTYAVAAGNGDANACALSPARVATAITVGASTFADQRAPYSNYGPCVDLFAPGSDNDSANNTSDLATAVLSGTSMATAHVAGVIATYLQGTSGLLPSAARDVLVEGSTADVLSGVGRGSTNRLLFSALAPSSAPPLRG